MKFKVTVTVKETKTYTYELDERNYRRAEDVACDRAVEEFRAMPNHDADDDIEVEAEQQTKECEECGVEYEIRTADRDEAPGAWYEDDDWCAKCGAKIEADDKKAQAEGEVNVARLPTL